MFQDAQMTGPQLNLWRTTENLSLRDVSDLLDKAGYKVTHVTLSRWERLPDPIPQWATDALLAKTRLELPLDLLYTMLDYAKKHDLSFGDVLSEALTRFLGNTPAQVTHLPEPPDGANAGLQAIHAQLEAAKQPKAAKPKGSASA